MNKFDEYVKEYCIDCKNRGNNKDLCNIVVNINGETQCENLEQKKRFLQ